MILVLDSSVSLKWVLPEAHSDLAIQLRDDFHNAVLDLIAPDIFAVETLHALTKAERQKRDGADHDGDTYDTPKSADGDVDGQDKRDDRGRDGADDQFRQQRRPGRAARAGDHHAECSANATLWPTPTHRVTSACLPPRSPVRTAVARQEKSSQKLK